MQFGIGQPVRRKEDRCFVTGAGRYLDDIKLPDTAYAYLLRSPHGHAAIRAIDVAAARTSPGVLAVLTGADAEADGVRPVPCLAPVAVKPGTPAQPMPRRPALATERVRHVGDAVALVIAETRDQAKDAAEQIVVDYEMLPAVTDLAAAVKPGAPQIWPEAPGNVDFVWADGDKAKTENAFAKASRVVAVEVVNNRVVPNSMEPRGAIGVFDKASGGYTLYASSQGAHLLKEIIAGAILPEAGAEKIRVVTPDVGGGFGMKIFVYPEYVLLLWAARRLGRPVKWIAERSEGFLSDTQGRDNITKAELALDADGKFLAIRVSTLANMGAYLSNFGPLIPTEAGKGMHVGVYAIPAAYVEVTGVFTNTVPVDAYRGAGRPEAAYMLERVVDRAGRETGLGPAEIRRRNFIPAAAMPFKTVLGHTYDSGDFAANLAKAMEAADWTGFPARQAESARRGKRRGIGISYYIEVCGGAPGVPALLRFERDDSVSLIVGTQSNGQGHETAYAQIVADRLGIPFDKVTLRQGDTAAMAAGSFTGGSRSVPVGGVATRMAADIVIDKGKRLAADLLEAAAADIEFRDGQYVVAGTDRMVDIFHVARAAPEPLAGEAEFAPEVATFPNGCHICELELDPETGSIALLRYTVVDDFGAVVNPLLLSGQVHGGIGQGIGQALLEHTVYDADGQLLSGSFTDYAMPRAGDVPAIHFRWNPILCRTNPLGIKGAGEAGAIGAPPAVINALVDALGGAAIDMPATPERVWRTLRG
ncbi:MAG TPA: xanthine dehydrogenase family protein molybdopterin-binding subunit [Stellaceae bacterium]|nr:xanthine dehydrogenase family protein molybdopterin-binding subunit [Stellaceae bacterium]